MTVSLRSDAWDFSRKCGVDGKASAFCWRSEHQVYSTRYSTQPATAGTWDIRREAGRIVSKVVIIAVAVNTEGVREVLGMAIGPSEAEPFWNLRSQKLHGVIGGSRVFTQPRPLPAIREPGPGRIPPPAGTDKASTPCDRVGYPAAARRRQAAARSAPHFRQRQRVPDSAGARLSGVSSWPLPQRLAGTTVSRTRFDPKSGNIEQVHSTPPLPLFPTTQSNAVGCTPYSAQSFPLPSSFGSIRPRVFPVFLPPDSG